MKDSDREAPKGNSQIFLSSCFLVIFLLFSEWCGFIDGGHEGYGEGMREGPI